MVSDFLSQTLDEKLSRLSRYYLPVILLSSSLMLAVALIINNIERRHPKFWFFHIPLPKKHIVPILDIVQDAYLDLDGKVNESEMSNAEPATVSDVSQYVLPLVSLTNCRTLLRNGDDPSLNRPQARTSQFRSVYFPVGPDGKLKQSSAVAVIE